MSYANITEDLSHVVRDASVEETSFIFDEPIEEDPGQRWAIRGRLATADEACDEVPFDLC